MAIQFIQATSNAPISGSTVAVATLPTSATNGDLLLMAISTVPPVSVTGVPAGWTLYAQGSAGAAFLGVKVRIYWKQASSEPAVYSSTLSLAEFYSTTVVAVRGQNGSSSAMDAQTSNFSVSGLAITIPSFNSSQANDLWLGYAFQYASPNLPAGWDLPVGWTKATQVTSAKESTVIGYQTLTASGASGTAIFSVSGGASINPWIGFSIGIIASAGAAPAAMIHSFSLLGVGR